MHWILFGTGYLELPYRYETMKNLSEMQALAYIREKKVYLIILSGLVLALAIPLLIRFMPLETRTHHIYFKADK